MNIVLSVLCVVLLVLGVTELIRILVFWWIRPDTAAEFSVVVAPESAENCEYLVRAAAERMRWLDFKGPCRLVCINRSGDVEMNRICRFLALRYPYLVVTNGDDMQNVLFPPSGEVENNT